jgi:hypothetical protein
MDTHQISMETAHKRAIQAPDDALRQPDKKKPRKEKPPPFPVRVDQDKAPGGDLLQPAICDRSSNNAKEKPPPFPVRVFQDKAPGGDLLRVATCGRHRNCSNVIKTKASPMGEAF